MPRTFAGSLQDALFRLQSEYGPVQCALQFKSPFELLVATVLSAQCTDARVNQVTPNLFKRFPSAEVLSKAKQETVEMLVRPTGFFRIKAKNLIALSTALVASHGGEVPRDLESLEALPGVGRKTANVVLGNAFGIASGIAVDTHVTRLMGLLGVVATKDPKKIEDVLKEAVPKDDWIVFTHYFITHGRQVCIARRPKCSQCVLLDLCPAGQQEIECLGGFSER